jgi:hypothetical protein
VKIRHRLLTATKREHVYYPGVRSRERWRTKAFHMMVDPHSLGLPCLCLLWKAAPGIASSLGSAAQNQLLEFRRDNPALMAARISLMSFVADYTTKPGTAKQPDGKKADSLTRLDYRAPR